MTYGHVCAFWCVSGSAKVSMHVCLTVPQVACSNEFLQVVCALGRAVLEPLIVWPLSPLESRHNITSSTSDWKLPSAKWTPWLSTSSQGVNKISQFRLNFVV